jgi:hypothetical protein
MKSKIFNKQIHGNSNFIQKQRLNNFNSLTRYYNVRLPIPISIQKIILLIEMQLNSAITRAKLIPYIFIVGDLCRMGIIFVDGKQETNQFQLLNVWNTISLPVQLYAKFNYRLSRKQINSIEAVEFFKNY